MWRITRNKEPCSSSSPSSCHAAEKLLARTDRTTHGREHHPTALSLGLFARLRFGFVRCQGFVRVLLWRRPYLEPHTIGKRRRRHAFAAHPRNSCRHIGVSPVTHAIRTPRENYCVKTIDRSKLSALATIGPPRSSRATSSTMVARPRGPWLGALPWQRRPRRARARGSACRRAAWQAWRAWARSRSDVRRRAGSRVECPCA